jgi:hypothetical protein
VGLLQQYDKETGYNPVNLVDTLLRELQLKNDAALARILRVDHSILSKVRHNRAPVTAGLLLRMHETTRVPVSSLRRWMGVQQL